MTFTKVDGKNIADIKIFALSTCGWCKKAKQFLNEKGIAYAYIDVDMLDDDENLTAIETIKKWNSIGSFPTIVINDKIGLRGFNSSDLMKALEK
jgi:glutaredoxin